jgi:hypothetical protein
MSVRIEYVDNKQLIGLFSQEKPFLIAYLRDHCPDSVFACESFLSPYLASYQGEGVLYAFEFERNRLYDLKAKRYRLSYWRFLHVYGLSDRFNLTFGYGRGHVPTFQFIVPNGSIPKDDAAVIKDMCVVYNDLRDMTNEQKVVIGKSYFDGTRPLGYTGMNLKGRELPAWRRDAIGVYHNELLKTFLDLYLPKTAV